MIAWLMLELWGSALQVVHQTVYRPADLPGLIAERGSRVVGLLTFQIDGSVLEVVTLNALERRAGVGTLLMEAVAAEARQRRCQEIHLTTTNDNLDAIRFYQRRGLRLVALRPGAVDRARVEWPEIPTDWRLRNSPAGRNRSRPPGLKSAPARSESGRINAFGKIFNGAP